MRKARNSSSPTALPLCSSSYFLFQAHLHLKPLLWSGSLVSKLQNRAVQEAESCTGHKAAPFSLTSPILISCLLDKNKDKCAHTTTNRNREREKETKAKQTNKKTTWPVVQICQKESKSAHLLQAMRMKSKMPKSGSHQELNLYLIIPCLSTL